MSPQMAWLSWCIVTLVAFVWLFSTVRFQMSLQIICLRRGIVTLVAFVWFFSTVGFQMCNEITSIRGSIVTLFASVWLFSTVYFQMSLQFTCFITCIITLVAFAWLFSSVNLYVCFQVACLRGNIFTLAATDWPLSSPSFCHCPGSFYVEIDFCRIIIFKILIHNFQQVSEEKGCKIDPHSIGVPWVLMLLDNNITRFELKDKWKWNLEIWTSHGEYSMVTTSYNCQ